MTPQNGEQRLFQEIERLRSLLEISRILNQDLDLPAVMQQVLELAVAVLQAEAGTLWMVDGEAEELVPFVSLGPRSEELKGLRLRKGEGIAGQVVVLNRAELIADVQADPRWASRFDNSTGFITRSMLCFPLPGRERVLGCLQLINKSDGSFFSSEDLELATAFGSQAALALENSRLFHDQKTLLGSLLKTLSSALDARDPYTRGHSERVTHYSLLIGKELGMSTAELEELERAALLHDIGKIGIRDDILLFQGPLSDEAWQTMRSHPTIGARIVGQLEPGHLVKQILGGTLYHQEKFDGRGYPQGVKGEEIPLSGRIIAIADTYDAMTTDRPYRRGLSKEDALAEIKRCAGSHFDPALARLFVVAMEKDHASGFSDGPSRQ